MPIEYFINLGKPKYYIKNINIKPFSFLIFFLSFGTARFGSRMLVLDNHEIRRNHEDP